MYEETNSNSEAYQVQEYGTTVPVESTADYNILYIYDLQWEDIQGFLWDIVGWFETLWNVYSVLAILLSLAFFVGFIYSKIRLSQLKEVEDELLRDEEVAWANRNQTGGTKSAKWESIQQKVAENNPESWRIAIIEADILLDETLTDAGYIGKSVGEKLKSANPESFKTVQDAWNAHKVRNEIAHVGSDFVLTKKTAQETLVYFERVFREFDVI